jgi:hypothetical protein
VGIETSTRPQAVPTTDGTGNCRFRLDYGVFTVARAILGGETPRGMIPVPAPPGPSGGALRDARRNNPALVAFNSLARLLLPPARARPFCPAVEFPLLPRGFFVVSSFR